MRIQKWTEFWEMFVDDAVSNNLSGGLFDQEKQELVGAFVGRDYHYFPASFSSLQKEINFISAAFILETEIHKSIPPEKLEIIQTKGLTMELWGAALRRQWRGRKVYHQLTRETEKRAKKQGYS